MREKFIEVTDDEMGKEYRRRFVVEGQAIAERSGPSSIEI